MNNTRKFPEGFLWGAATSAHQVEGGMCNDWSEWERETAKSLAQNAKSKKWARHIMEKYPSPLEKENYISAQAVDHYNRYEEDFDLAKSLGHTAHRFSVEWSRIEPKEGEFNKKEIEHYRAVIQALRTRGMEPLVTLWHWTIPLWLRDKGGVNAKKFSYYFARFAGKMAEEYKNDVTYWITLNEPNVHTGHAYGQGTWPPHKRSPFSYMYAVGALLHAHRDAFNTIKRSCPKAQIGIAKNNIYFEAYKGRMVNNILKYMADWWWNKYFLDRIQDYQHFIGLNHYFHNRINYGFNKNENKNISDMGWELYPESLYRVLMDLKKYKKPIFVTENGLADARDIMRTEFIRSSLHSVLRAIDSGVDVRGYLYWSLLDNFEWDKGFWPRFGLIEIDYKTLKRTVRQSAWEYKKIIDEYKI
ncbi:MAG: hypothetical protein COU90_00985 [Candidatus Ryanbacteria bacterium CG10_big_fil_rev_8_21_14_0_10_43_42]|uniref:Glycoside hydrolase family 1 protein n=1 Tax=Candidatus Ryanbacteria bacterium CG10_big_fil_rev_8_21_14_0_10_43_42 TaxID=1974864 RepID=A0A2M8KY63_9BACT|nr:MAG: hypothetical protein COU90_00985 [Candidatus Ryanbacteria bacterium CG10_big_fil_rev_8_21_14_0_10_43_42]